MSSLNLEADGTEARPVLASGPWSSLSQKQKKKLKKLSFKDGGIRADLKAAKKHQQSGKLDVVFLAKDEEILGWALSAPVFDDGAGEKERFGSIFVKKKHRKNGYGLLLAEALAKKSKALGHNLMVFSHDPKSNSLFKKLQTTCPWVDVTLDEGRP